MEIDHLNKQLEIKTNIIVSVQTEMQPMKTTDVQFNKIKYLAINESKVKMEQAIIQAQTTQQLEEVDTAPDPPIDSICMKKRLNHQKVNQTKKQQTSINVCV